MENLTLIIAVLAVIGGVSLAIGIWYAPQVIVSALAKNKKIFTAPEESTAEAVISGEQLDHMVMAMTGFDFIGNLYSKSWKDEWISLRKKENENRLTQKQPQLNEEPEEIDQYEVIPVPQNQIVVRNKIEKVLLPYEGYRFIGIPPTYKILKYPFAWIGVGLVAADGKKDFKVHEERPIENIYLREVVYAMFIIDLELKEKFQADITLLIRAVVRNPARALFKVHRWLDATWKGIVSEIRKEVPKYTYEELIGISTQAGDPEKPGNGPGKDLLKDLEWIHDVVIRNTYGVDIQLILMYSVDPAGSQTDLRDATLQGVIERMKGEGKKQAASAEAEALKTYDEVARKVSPQTLTLKGYATLEKTKSNVILNAGQGMPVFVNIPAAKPENDTSTS